MEEDCNIQSLMNCFPAYIPDNIALSVQWTGPCTKSSPYSLITHFKVLNYYTHHYGLLYPPFTSYQVFLVDCPKKISGFTMLPLTLEAKICILDVALVLMSHSIRIRWGFAGTQIGLADESLNGDDIPVQQLQHPEIQICHWVPCFHCTSLIFEDSWGLWPLKSPWDTILGTNSMNFCPTFLLEYWS